jgi:hypothetical protein
MKNKNKKNKPEIMIFSREGVVQEVYVERVKHTLHRINLVEKIAILFNVNEARFIEIPLKWAPALAD